MIRRIALPVTSGFALLVIALLASACSMSEKRAENIQTSAEYVLTLQTGTVSELKNLRNQGPFSTYELSPDAMLSVLEKAMKRAGTNEEPPYVKVYVSERYGEVLAKEFGEPYKGYSDPFRSAALAIVHPVQGAPGRSRVEIHTAHRGPFHRGSVPWERSLPGWIDEAIAARRIVQRIP